MTVDETYVLVKYICNKNMQGFITPSNFKMAINQAVRSYISYLLGSLQQYTPGRPVARVELGQNSVVRQRLAPVIFKSTLTVDVSGNADYPTDYLQTDSMLTTSFKKIRYVEQTKLDSTYNSVITPISSNPIYLLENSRFQFYPTTIGAAVLSYIGDPKDIVWASKKDANQRDIYITGIASVPILKGGTGYSSATIVFAPPVDGITATGTVTIVSGVITGVVMTEYGTGYNNTVPTYTFTGIGGTGAELGIPVVSVDPVFNNTSMLEVIVRALKIIGVNLQSQQVLAYSKDVENVGQ